MKVAEALAHATDPTVREVLARVAADETRHSELVWRFVRWVLEHGEHDLKVATERELARIVQSECRASRREGRVTSPDEALCDHGVIDVATRLELRGRVISEVIAPCAQALAAGMSTERRESLAVAAAALAALDGEVTPSECRI